MYIKMKYGLPGWHVTKLSPKNLGGAFIFVEISIKIRKKDLKIVQ